MAVFDLDWALRELTKKRAIINVRRVFIAVFAEDRLRVWEAASL
jgi:hypothetical protein